MIKTHVLAFVEYFVWNDPIDRSTVNEINEKAKKNLEMALTQGYELVAHVPFNTTTVAGCKYFFVKKTLVEEEKDATVETK